MAIAAVSTFTGAHATRLIAGAGWVGGSAIAGLDTAGTVWAAVSALAAAGSLWVAIAANNRAKRREYRAEIDAAEQRGAKQERQRVRELADELREARNERDFYRQQWAARWGEPPLPPPSKGADQ